MCTYWETQLKTSLSDKNWNEIKEQLAKANCSIQGDTEKTTLHECWHTAYIQY